MLDFGGFEIAEQLRDMFIGQRARRLKLDNQAILDEQIGVVITNDGAVLVIDLERVLLLHVQAEFAQPMGQGVLIHLLQVAMPVVDVNGVSGFTHDVAEFINGLHVGFLISPQRVAENAKK